MPDSSDIFDDSIEKLLRVWNFNRYLDVGTGAGKYGKMIRTFVPSSHITGVEVSKEYIERFNLTSIYNQIINEDARSIIDGVQDSTYDVVIIGD